MKRIIIMFALLGICIGMSLYTIHHVNRVSEIMHISVSSVFSALEERNQKDLENAITELCNYWRKEEERVIYFVRHAQIDDITKSVSRLDALMVWEDYAELSAELSSILWQIDLIQHSECEVFVNLL